MLLAVASGIVALGCWAVVFYAIGYHYGRRVARTEVSDACDSRHTVEHDNTFSAHEVFPTGPWTERLRAK